MAKRDYYEILGVNKTVDDKELKKAYRKVAMKHHPDRNAGDAESESKFKEASEAYEILSDGNKRARYDQYGHDGVNNQAGGGGGFHGADVGDIFGDVFGDIFGGRRGGGQQRRQRGSDLQYNLDVTLEEAVKGTTTKIRIPTYRPCDPCDGSGSKSGNKSTCGSCGGAGQVRMQQGFFSVQQTCPNCRGAGQTITDPCSSCHGQGRVKDSKTLSVKIPAGVDSGDRIRLTGEGEAGPNGAQSGDLFVQIDIHQHAIFERDGSNLYCEIPINIVLASLGGELEVPTLDGRVRLKIPAETQTGKLFRLRGKGVKSVHGGPQGDILCRVTVETPVNLTKKQKELLEKLNDELGNQSHSPNAHSWLGKVKGFFEALK